VRSWRFLRPVFIGETITDETEVTELRGTSRPDRGVMTQRMRVLNQRGELVNEGELVTLLRRRR
jgi:acyl dehydratase